MGESRVQMKCPNCGHIFLPALEEKQSRAGKSARRKGHAFERKIAKLLEEWWNQNGKFKYLFRRTPQSGGSALKEGWGLAGDIATTAPDFRFHLELKNAPGSFAGLHQFASCEKFKVWTWLEQAETDCPLGKRAILIVNRYDQPTWCMARESPFISEVVPRATRTWYIYHHWTNTDTLYIWKFDDMLASSPELWK